MEAKNRRKSLIILLVVLAVAVLYSGWRNLRPGIFLGDQFFYKTGEARFQYNDDNWITHAPGGGQLDFTVCLEGETQSVGLLWEDDQVTFLYENGETMKGIWDSRWLFSMSDEGDQEFYTNGQWQLNSALCRISRGETETRGSIGLILVGIFVYGLGMLGIYFPNQLHFFGRRWAYQETELSDAGMLAEQIGGGVCILFGILLVTGWILPLFGA